jgi:hypothetical protein
VQRNFCQPLKSAWYSSSAKGLQAVREAFCFEETQNGSKMTIYFSQTSAQRNLIKCRSRCFARRKYGDWERAPDLSHAPHTGSVLRREELKHISFFIPAITLARNTIKVRADICVQDYTGKNLTTCQHHEFARKL